MYFHRWVPTFWWNIMLSSTLKMDEVCIIKMLVPTYQITLRCNLKDQNLVHSMVCPTKMQTREVTNEELLKVTVEHTQFCVKFRVISPNKMSQNWVDLPCSIEYIFLFVR